MAACLQVLQDGFYYFLHGIARKRVSVDELSLAESGCIPGNGHVGDAWDATGDGDGEIHVLYTHGLIKNELRANQDFKRHEKVDPKSLGSFLAQP